MGLTEK